MHPGRAAAAGPRVSVVLAVHNGEPFLAEAIESVLRQSFDDLELIVVDDGSTDGSARVAASYPDPRIRLLANSRKLGLASSLNRGIALARGEFVARQDADDVSEPRRLERQVAFLDENPRVGLVGTWCTEIGEDGMPRRSHSFPCEDIDLVWSLLLVCPFVHSAVMWRRQAVRDGVGAYDESLRYSLDFELWTRIARRMPMANVAEPLVRLRVHGSSMTASADQATREGHRMRVAEVGRLLGWDGSRWEQNEARFSALSRLLRGVEGGATREDVEEGVVEEALRLHEARFAESRFPRPEVDRHRARLRAKIGRSLLDAAAARERAGDLAAARALAVRGIRLDPGRLLRRRTIGLGLRLVRPARDAGSRGVREGCS